MFLLLRVFNSIFFVIGNLSITLYTLQRLFRAMRSHYQLVDEVEDFSCLVDQSRASLEFVGCKVMEAIKEMKFDIGKEVYVTHNLTALTAKIASLSKRFNELEEGIIELARLSENLENATVETPLDINQEVRKILRRRSTVDESNHHQNLQECPRSPQSPQSPQSSQSPQTPQSPRKQLKVLRNQGTIETVQSQPNPGSTSKISSVTPTRYSQKSHSPSLVPDVMLLNDQRSVNPIEKPIGFRPPWMCHV